MNVEGRRRGRQKKRWIDRIEKYMSIVSVNKREVGYEIESYGGVGQG